MDNMFCTYCSLVKVNITVKRDEVSNFDKLSRFPFLERLSESLFDRRQSPWCATYVESHRMTLELVGSFDDTRFEIIDLYDSESALLEGEIPKRVKAIFRNTTHHLRVGTVGDFKEFY